MCVCVGGGGKREKGGYLIYLFIVNFSKEQDAGPYSNMKNLIVIFLKGVLELFQPPRLEPKTQPAHSYTNTNFFLNMYPIQWQTELLSKYSLVKA